MLSWKLRLEVFKDITDIISIKKSFSDNEANLHFYLNTVLWQI